MLTLLERSVLHQEIRNLSPKFEYWEKPKENCKCKWRRQARPKSSTFCIPAFSIPGAINGVRPAAALTPGSAPAQINLATPSALLPALAYTQQIQVAQINGDCQLGKDFLRTLCLPSVLEGTSSRVSMSQSLTKLYILIYSNVKSSCHLLPTNHMDPTPPRLGFQSRQARKQHRG